MPRVPRELIISPDLSVHKVWRGHNKEWNLNTPKEKQRYLKYMMDEHDKDKPNPMQAMCIMSNHSHEIVHIEDVKAFSSQMRRHHSRYGIFFNKMKKRSGKVAEDRPKTGLIGSYEDEMRVTFYVHANPLRAKIVKDAKNYAWSTHKLYAFGIKPKWLRHFVWPEWYLALGKNWTLRRKMYRKLFDAYLRDKGLVKDPSIYQHFIGPALWKLPLQEKVSQWYRSHAPPKDV